MTVRNALIVLVVVALVLAFVGAFNTGQRVDVDYVVGTWTSVSLAWLLFIAAALLLAGGLVGAAFTRVSGATERRKLETELQSTYRRLREAQATASAAATAGVARQTAEPSPVVAETPTAQSPTVVGEAPTAAAPTVAAEAPTTVLEAPTVVDDAPTAAQEVPTAVTAAEPDGEAPAAAEPAIPSEDAPTVAIDAPEAGGSSESPPA